MAEKTVVGDEIPRRAEGRRGKQGKGRRGMHSKSSESTPVILLAKNIENDKFRQG
jgi:hypothetical protein